MILIVILFAIMMSQDIYKAKISDYVKKLFFPAVFSILILFGLVKVFSQIQWHAIEAEAFRFPTTEKIGIGNSILSDSKGNIWFTGAEANNDFEKWVV